MSKDDFQRFEYLSEVSIFGEPTEIELKELHKLMSLWDVEVKSKQQQHSMSNQHF